MRPIVRICFITLAVLLAATSLLACGGPEAPPPAPAPAPAPTPAPAPAPAPAPTPTPPPAPPTGNQPPDIVSLTAEPEKVDPGGTSTITCAATDPDGDTLSYSWSVTGGTFSRREEVILWEAPEADGEFVISVTVKDGKGGIAEKQLTIIVGSPPITILLEPIQGESGSVYSTGDLVPCCWLVGDNAENNGVRAFFSFDITALTLADIKEAKLTFDTKEIVGNPWHIHAFLFVEQVDYGERPLQGGDFDIKGQELAKFSASPPGQVDVALPLARLLRPPFKHRFQMRLRLGQNTTYNNEEDYISFSGAAINVTYVKK